MTWHWDSLRTLIRNLPNHRDAEIRFLGFDNYFPGGPEIRLRRPSLEYIRSGDTTRFFFAVNNVTSPPGRFVAVLMVQDRRHEIVTLWITHQQRAERTWTPLGARKLLLILAPCAIDD
jgi:hypothetical protein